MKNFANQLKTKVRNVFGRSDSMQSGDFPVALWRRLKQQDMRNLAQYIPELNSQYGQDLFVLCCALNIPEMPRVFVEAGAADGIQWSNTRILESECGWSGVLVEPCRGFEESLRGNRSSQIDTRCLVPRGGPQILFREVRPPSTRFPISSPELSCIDNLSPADWASNVRANNSITYKVDTVDFNQLKSEHCLPDRIGYLSLDTEGSELQILQSIDWSQCEIDVLTVEHGNRKTKSDLRKFMNDKGYQPVLEDVSQCDFWFVRRSLLASLYFV